MEPVWDQFAALLPERRDTHPLGCHRPRIPDRVVFDKLIQVLVFGCAYERIADHTCSERTLRRRRDEWITAGTMAGLERIARDAYDRMIGLNLADLAVDGCITKAPCGGEVAGRSPVDRGKQGLKRSVASDGDGIPLGWVVAPANTMTRRCWRPPWKPSPGWGHCPPSPRCTWTGATTAARPAPAWPRVAWTARSPTRARPPPSRPASGGQWSAPTRGATRSASSAGAPSGAGGWSGFYLALAHTIIIVRRLVRCAWTCSRWQGRPGRRP
jgi:hypothetical protein